MKSGEHYNAAMKRHPQEQPKIDERPGEQQKGTIQTSTHESVFPFTLTIQNSAMRNYCARIFLLFN